MGLNTISGTAVHENGPILRTETINVHFSCELQQNQQVSLDQAITALSGNVDFNLKSQIGAYKVAMSVYTNENFTTKADEDYPVFMPNPIYFAVSLQKNDAGDMKLQATKCWATPTSDPDDVVNFVFVDNSCNIQDDSLKMTRQGRSIEFALNSFVFKHADTLFLHCNVRLCDPEVEDCNKKCNSGRSRRSAELDASVKVGPIHILV